MSDPGRRSGLYGGGDWSGTPDEPVGAVELYSFCVVALEDLEAVNEACRETRQMLGMAASKEFHARNMSDTMRAAVLEMTLELGGRVGLLIVNKAAVPLSGRVALPPPAVLTSQIAFRLLPHFLPLYPLRDLWCDEEIDGKKAQQEFEAEAQRLSRRFCPVKTKVRIRKSHTSNLIQIADVAVYTLTRQARDAQMEPVLRNVLRKIRADNRHLILGPVPWEERRED